ncbi:hypothetical protein E2K93_04425 [Thalassotalea sp. HSM 43]|uniref:hypothetical protein n=1 Tax=Thalassotalea sp. HSM 43 TaxID=2552945 RepID=UPI001080342F|nr:hypothetical protein [Thalassotalea sp. HSM 43]QBY03671.1 hypothetical protein E2K93_04425 [Thalassotalea sp. HSM 43]
MNRIAHCLLLSAIVYSTCSIASEQQHDNMNMDMDMDMNMDMNMDMSQAVAPISVMGSHIHKKGHWMVSYRYMTMDMQDLQLGKDPISSDYALESYMMVPDEMSMDMHMFGAMYGYSDDLTLMVTANFIDQEMTSLMRPMMGMMATYQKPVSITANTPMYDGMMPAMATEVEMSSDGLADVHIRAMYRTYTSTKVDSHISLGVGLPVGDIDQSRTNMMGDKVIMGYPMQIGSETTDLLATYTIKFSENSYQLGAQFNYQTALDENDANYEPGDQLQVHSWVSFLFDNNLNVSMRISFTDIDNYSGRDDRLNPMMSPVADVNMRGAKIWDWAIGTSYRFSNPTLMGNSLSFEYSEPLEEDFDGVQLQTSKQITFAWQYMF